ncbi:endoglucanase 18 [Selaginella moellendorffii]|uniref:endoglucanase 18 n=1 Tax=Selaginella moellendorffii TaxID=88036 RepID=UPI000D1CFA0B|nr:endoglucanase 18 [Selaginella moellendorffii]|eukprot:XP_024526980.1 endoglucanase 18 [Selaginella moellendorffii]
MAFTITMLCWGAIEYGRLIDAAGEMGNLRDAIRWGTDYFLRANTGSSELWVQVGDPYKDHNCWQRPEDMESPRKSYLINQTSPGTEVAAETSAALASASIVFQSSDPSYSTKLLQSAIRLFQFADRFRGTFSGGCPFYCSVSGYQDELLWAASWLYKSTGSSMYLSYVIDHADKSGIVSEFSWENKHAGVQVFLSTLYLKGGGFDALKRYKDEADFFFCATLPNTSQTQVDRTPGGFIYVRSGANTQYSIGASFLAAVYADSLAQAQVSSTVSCGRTLLGPRDLLNFAKGQADYILGDNPRRISYMVGFGSSFPQQPHHRGASIESVAKLHARVSCGEGFYTWYSSKSPNPNELTGAIVGGPDRDDSFVDLRSNSAQLEPTTYVNAPFVGLLARLTAQI